MSWNEGWYCKTNIFTAADSDCITVTLPSAHSAAGAFKKQTSNLLYIENLVKTPLTHMPVTQWVLARDGLGHATQDAVQSYQGDMLCSPPNRGQHVNGLALQQPPPCHVTRDTQRRYHQLHPGKALQVRNKPSQVCPCCYPGPDQ